MSPYFSLYRKLQPVRSKEFNVYVKPDVIQGALIKIEEMGPSRRAPISKIYVSLDIAIELCDQLDQMEQLYNEFRPLPRDGQLKYEEIVDQDSTYQMDLSINNYRQNLRITQSKPRLTRGPSHSITIPDIGNFRRQLTPIVDELSNTHLTPIVEEDRGVNKVIRGNRAAVVYSTIRPWPWTRSYTTGRLLFDPNLIALIVFDRDVGRIRDYCERVYPDLMVDAYVDMNYDHNEWDALYGNLKVRWIPRGQQFLVRNDMRVGTLCYMNEDSWHAA